MVSYPSTDEAMYCAGGPVLVRGLCTLIDEDGCPHPNSRPVAAVCRCSTSARKPWCDGTHKYLRDPDIADEVSVVAMGAGDFELVRDLPRA